MKQHDRMRQHSPIVRLYDRLSRKVERGEGIQMSPEDVDWLILTGAYKAVVTAAEAKAFERARERVEARGDHLDDLKLLIDAREEGRSAKEGKSDE